MYEQAGGLIEATSRPLRDREEEIQSSAHR